MSFSLSATAFRPDYLDFQLGIRVGNLEENERISKILKLALEDRHKQSFVTEKYGRGSYWQWLGFLTRSNRLAKPISSHISFGCSKFFIMVDREEKLFKCGMQVERGMIKASPEYPDSQLRPDWDWFRLLAGLKSKSLLQTELKRLVCEEEFCIEGGAWDEGLKKFSKNNFPEMQRIKQILEKASPNFWGGFQVYYSMNEQEVKGSRGVELVEAMLAIFEEVIPLMNCCMQVPI